MSKELVKKIVQRLNTVPVGIKFNFGTEETREGMTYAEPMKYCEIVYRAKRTGRTYVLDSGSISCQAAKEVFGIVDEKSSNIKNHFGEFLESIKSEQSVDKILNSSEILKLKDKPNSITIGALIPNPDVYILFLNSNNCDKVVKAYTQLFYNNKIDIVIDVSNIMPVCYNSTVRPYLKDNISISWVMGNNENCNEFIKNSMVVGIPRDKIEAFINYIEDDEDKSLYINEA